MVYWPSVWSVAVVMVSMYMMVVMFYWCVIVAWFPTRRRWNTVNVTLYIMRVNAR